MAIGSENIKFKLTGEDKTGAAFKSLNTRLKSVGGGLAKIAGGFLKLGALVGVSAGAAVTGLAPMIDELQKASQKLGIATSELTALKHAANLSGVEFTAFTKAMQAMQRGVSEAAIGTGTAKDALAELGLNAKEIVNLAPQDQFNAIADALAGVGNSADKLRLAERIFGARGASVLQMMEQGAAGINAMKQEADDLGITINRVQADSVANMNDAFTRLGALLSGIAQKVVVFLAPALEKLANFLREKIGGAFAYINRNFTNLLVGTADFLRKFSMEGSGAYNTAAALYEYAASLQTAASAKDELAKKETNLQQKLSVATGGETKKKTSSKSDAKEAKEYTDALTQLSAQVNTTYGDVRKFTADGLIEMQDQFLEGIKGAQSFGDAFKSLAQTIEDAIIKIAFQKTVTSPLAGVFDKLIGNASESGAKSVIGGGGIDGLFSGIGDFFGGLFADGGNPPIGKASIVGENGPELIIPRRASTVIPNDAMGGGQIVQNINVTTGVQSTVRAEIQNLMPQITAAARAAVADSARRGGSFKQAFT